MHTIQSCRRAPARKADQMEGLLSGKFGIAFGVGLFLVAMMLMCAIRHTKADERRPECAQLETLAQQYAGHALTISERAFKVRAVAWYGANCKRPREARRKD